MYVENTSTVGGFAWLRQVIRARANTPVRRTIARLINNSPSSIISLVTRCYAGTGGAARGGVFASETSGILAADE